MTFYRQHGKYQEKMTFKVSPNNISLCICSNLADLNGCDAWIAKLFFSCMHADLCICWKCFL